MRTCGIRPQAKPETSRFPCKELPHMPVSLTTPGWAGARNTRPSMLPSVRPTTSAPKTFKLSRLHNWPMRSPADASSSSSRMPTHGSGPMRFATPSSWRTFTTTPCRFLRRTGLLEFCTSICRDVLRRHGLSSRQRVRMLAIMAALPKEGPPPKWSLPRSMLMRPPSRLHAAMALRVTSPLYQACGVISFEMCHQWSSLAARERATRRTHSHCGTRPRRMMDCAGLAGLPFPIRLSFCFGGVIREKARNKSHRASSKFHR